MGETIVLKAAISVLVLWVVAFPSGALYSRGKLTGDWFASLVGTAAAGVAVVALAPDFEPLGASVFAIVWTGIVSALGVRFSLFLFRRFLRRAE
jgi:Na+-driven multidrug efflux pump